MRIPSYLAALLCLEALCAGCDAPPAGGPAPGSPADSDSAPGERIVVLQEGSLHLEPDLASPGITEVRAGALLEVVHDSAGREEWVRVATWDGRRGWLPVSSTIEPEQWSQYAGALGGVSPILARPGYPVAGGRWGVEAPVGSAGLTVASSAWLLGDSARVAHVVKIDTVENVCGGDGHRFAALDLPAGATDWPRLEEGLLATPSGGLPAARYLAIEPLEPDSALSGLASAATLEMGRRMRIDAGTPASVEWRALGADAAWAAIAWPAEEDSTGQSQLGVALVFRRAAGGWEQVGRLGPAGSSATPPTPAWRPVAAYAAGSARFPTILLLEALEFEGAHLDVWIARGDRYHRTYQGYYWGC